MKQTPTLRGFRDVHFKKGTQTIDRCQKYGARRPMCYNQVTSRSVWGLVVSEIYIERLAERVKDVD